jgi:hypothetical protein
MFGLSVNWWLNAFLAACICVFALRFGNKEERLASIVIMLGWCTEPFVHDRIHPQIPEIGLVISDIIALCLFLFISFRSRKLWTLFLSASQLNGIITHITAATHLQIPVAGYFGLNWIWTGYGLLLALLVGTIQSIRERKRVAAPEEIVPEQAA